MFLERYWNLIRMMLLNTVICFLPFNTQKIFHLKLCTPSISRGTAGNQLYDADLLQFSNNKEPDRKLVIGYLSPDFCKHPVGFFLTPVLSAHNREYYKVICYLTEKTDIQTFDARIKFRLVARYFQQH